MARGWPPRTAGPMLDVGAGTGRVALELARAGHRVVALDRDPELLAALARGRRPSGSSCGSLWPMRATSRSDERFALCLVPMQTIQLLGGAAGRAAVPRRRACPPAPRRPPGDRDLRGRSSRSTPGRRALSASRHVERDGTVYCSQPTAVRATGGTFVLERRREIVDPRGGHEVFDDAIALDALTAETLEREAADAGLRPAARAAIASTDEYVGSTVVMCDA